MSNNRIRIVAGLLAAAALAVLPQGAAAQVDFTRYVAVGDSLTAGFQSGGLFRTAQNNSYPALIFRQATGQTAGFEQPLVSDPGIPAALELKRLVPLPVVIAPRAGQGQPLNTGLLRPYNNIAVPGARVHDVVVTLNGGLHDLVLRNTPQRTIGTQLQQAAALHPTFATIWIGNNDVLAAATSGRAIEGVTLTPVAQFEADYRTIVNTLVASGTTRFAFANIPDVTSIAFVTTIPGVIVDPTTNQPVLVNGQPVPLIGVNPATDRVLLTATGALAQGLGIPTALGGSGQPLPDQFFLNAAEIAAINAKVSAYNNIIRAVANERSAALFDANALLAQAAAGHFSVGGVTVSAAFLSGGLFSYDGVHPTTLGYALTANGFIEAINRTYNEDIPLVNLAPFLFGTASGASTAGRVAADAGVASGPTVHLSLEAWQNLRWALRIPSNAEIDAATPSKPRKPRRRGR